MRVCVCVHVAVAGVIKRKRSTVCLQAVIGLLTDVKAEGQPSIPPGDSRVSRASNYSKAVSQDDAPRGLETEVDSPWQRSPQSEMLPAPTSTNSRHTESPPGRVSVAPPSGDDTSMGEAECLGRGRGGYHIVCSGMFDPRPLQ